MIEPIKEFKRSAKEALELSSILPASPLWHQRAKAISCLNIRYSAQVLGCFEVVSRKGGVMHDAFGRVLEQVDSSAFNALWRPAVDAERYPQFGSHSPPKAFTLNPPRDNKGAYQTGDKFNFNLVLFGKASAHANACTTAILKLGQFGLGSKDAKFTLTACDLSEQSVTALSEQWLNAAGPPEKPNELYPRINIKLNFVSPAYLKSNQKILVQAPAFTYLLARMIYRANWLSVCSGKGVLISNLLRTQMLEQATTVTTEVDNSYVDVWKRYSISRNKWMRFDGLAGSVIYSGVSAELLPLLELVAAINLGGKTSFGMGEIRWSVE